MLFLFRNKEEVKQMKEFTYVITDEVGLHARPAGLLAKEAKNTKAPLHCMQMVRKQLQVS